MSVVYGLLVGVKLVAILSGNWLVYLITLAQTFHAVLPYFISVLSVLFVGNLTFKKLSVMTNTVLNGFGTVTYHVNSNMANAHAALEEYRKNNPTSNQHNSIGFGVQARRRMIKTCSAFSELVESVNRHYTLQHKTKPLYPTFITLTYPGLQQHDDRFLRANHLKPFLQECQRKGYLTQYVWKAEVQKRDVLHFHILGDHYVEANNIQNLWNRIIEGENYVSAWQKKYPNKQPSSTHIRGIKDIAAAHKYMGKYIAKDEISHSKKRDLDCRSWGSSDKIKEIQIPNVSSVFTGNWQPFNDEHSTKQFTRIIDMLEPNRQKVLISDYCEVQYFRNHTHKILKQMAPRAATNYQYLYFSQAQGIY